VQEASGAMQEERSYSMNSSTFSWAESGVLEHSPGKVPLLPFVT
jgi:hypothetical protein